MRHTHFAGISVVSFALLSVVNYTVCPVSNLICDLGLGTQVETCCSPILPPTIHNTPNWCFDVRRWSGGCEMCWKWKSNWSVEVRLGIGHITAVGWHCILCITSSTFPRKEAPFWVEVLPFLCVKRWAISDANALRMSSHPPHGWTPQLFWQSTLTFLLTWLKFQMLEGADDVWDFTERCVISGSVLLSILCSLSRPAQPLRHAKSQGDAGIQE